MKALVYGGGGELMNALPALFSRAGFAVDVIATDRHSKRLKYARDVMIVDSIQDVVTELLREERADYQLYVPTDDLILSAIKAAPMSAGKKAALLAVTSEASFIHIFSKIGLAKVLEENRICAPRYAVAYDQAGIFECAKTIQLPLMVKIDSSNGGSGVYECQSDADIQKLSGLVFPVLAQEKIDGDLLDLSGYYRQEKLVHFSYSQILVPQRSQFGPSSVRKYTVREHLDASVFHILSKLGGAVGAHGFVTVSCIKSHADGQLYFIEADMRPNAWVEHAKYFGDDPATHIRRYFEKGEFLFDQVPASGTVARNDIILAYLPRLDGISVLLNKYNCWNHYDNYLGFAFVRRHFFKLAIAFAVENIKPNIPKFAWACLRKVPLKQLCH